MLEGKEKKKREEINKFFKATEKYYNTFSFQDAQLIGTLATPTLNATSLFSTNSINPNRSLSLPPEGQDRMLIKKKKSANTPTHHKKDDGAYFLKLIEKYRPKYRKSPFIITLQQQVLELEWDSSNQYQILDIEAPRGPLDPNRELTADDDIWELMPYKGLTPEQKYRKYKKLGSRAHRKHENKGQKMMLDRKTTSEQKEMNEDKGIYEEKEQSERLYVGDDEKPEESDKSEQDQRIEQIEELEQAEEMEKIEQVEQGELIEQIEQGEQIEQTEQLEQSDQMEDLEETKQTELMEQVEQMDEEEEEQEVPNLDELSEKLIVEEAKDLGEVRESSDAKDANDMSDVSELEEFKFGDCQIGIQATQIFSEPESPVPRPLITAAAPPPPNSEFKIKMVKISYLERCNLDPSLPFDISYLSNAILIDDKAFKEVPVCICRKSYKGEVLISNLPILPTFFNLLLACESCEEVFHPMCVGFPPNIDPSGLSWKCRTCLRQAMPERERHGMAEGMIMASLIGKRPNSGSLQSEPGIGKKISFGSNLEHYY